MHISRALLHAPRGMATDAPAVPIAPKIPMST
jgi:hypothetical protein